MAGAKQQVFKKIISDWDLSRQDVADLLEIAMTDSEATTLCGREDRQVRLIYEIYRVLSSLFADLPSQRKWLRAPNSFLKGRAPLDVMMAHESNRIPGMILVRDLVERVAGR